MPRASSSARTLTDHEEIQSWAEERGATPACVRGTGQGDDVGMIRLDFPGYSGGESLEEISWDGWFDKFEESNLALLVQEKTAAGESSNFNKLVSRDAGENSSRASRRSGSTDASLRRESRRARSSNTTARTSSSRSSGRSSAKRKSSGGAKRRASSGPSTNSSRQKGQTTAKGSQKKGVSRAGRRSGTRRRAA